MKTRVSLVVLGVVIVGAMVAPVQAQTPPFTRTVIVNATNNPLVNGAALLSAVAGIPPSAGPNQPWLVKVEPGVFDLGGSQLIMRNFVDIEGSGRDTTYVTSDVSQIADGSATVRVPQDVECELRELTVRNTSESSGAGVEIDTDEFLLTEVNIEIKVERDGVGIRTRKSSPRLNEVFSRVLAGRDATGILIASGGTVVTDSLVFVSSPGATNTAVVVVEKAAAVLDQVIAFSLLGERNVGVLVAAGAEAQIVNTRSLSSGGGETTGLAVEDEGSVDVKESTFTAVGDSLATALKIQDSRAQVTESTFRAEPDRIDHPNVYAVRLLNAATLNGNQSNFESTSFAVSNGGTGIASFGSSQLIGQAVSVSFLGLRCVFAYKGNYTARNALCQ